MLVAVVLLAGCGGSKEEAGKTAAAPRRVVELASVRPFTQQFDADRGKPRLLLILSPT
jgi:hypothetical protein